MLSIATDKSGRSNNLPFNFGNLSDTGHLNQPVPPAAKAKHATLEYPAMTGRSSAGAVLRVRCRCSQLSAKIGSCARGASSPLVPSSQPYKLTHHGFYEPSTAQERREMVANLLAGCAARSLDEPDSRGRGGISHTRSRLRAVGSTRESSNAPIDSA